MCVMCSMAYVATGVVVLATSTGLPVVGVLANNTTSGQQISEQVLSLQELPQATASLKMPTLKEPEWLRQQNAAEAAARAAAAAARATRSVVVTYDVITKGAIVADIAQFKSQANASLNDARGWARMGVVFQEVASGGMFTLVLSEASQIPTFSSGCGTEYSCRSGRYVIINQDRWLGATASWNQGGGSLRDYRHMVVNHETGHWLGHEHEFCGGPGQAAPVMQQQSIDLKGCVFNAWPLDSELWSTQLGIRKA